MQTEIISTQVFSCSGISVFVIPPGDLSMAQWTNYDTNYIWKGNLKVEEQEIIEEGDWQPTSTLKLPADRIRLKLELYNNTNNTWAVVWYNPPHEGYEILETIQRTESSRIFKIIAQLPDSLYGGLEPLTNVNKVALGLKFGDKIDAYEFIEKLESYKKQFTSFIDQYLYELEVKEAIHKVDDLTINSKDQNTNIDQIKDHESNDIDNDNSTAHIESKDIDEEEEDDDDFGDFVS